MSETHTTTSPPGRKLLITIDVEALPNRSESQHVERLIWGRFGGEELGIRRMMSIAGQHGRRLTFFVDLCEVLLYPNDFEEIAEAILNEGHDLQLHAHQPVLPADFWRSRGFTRWTSELRKISFDQAGELMRFLVETAKRLGQPHPIAFRGGAFAYNDAILAAMAEHGVRLGFNYNVKSRYQYNNRENLPAFRWSNGITEFPMSVLPFAGDLQGFEFSSVSKLDFSDRTRVEAYINRYFTLLGEDAVLVMLMHSWSFLYLNGDTGYFENKGAGLASRFDRFLSDLPPDLDVITAADAARLIDDGQLKPERVRNVELARDVQNAQKTDSQAIVDFVSTSLAPGSTVAVISKGDENLINLNGCRGWHFPQTSDGVYAGYHPEDSGAVIAHLEDLRSRGADFLLVPKTSLWWLDYYGEFRHHLNTHYKVVAYKEAAGVLFDLCEDSRADVLKSLYARSDGGR